MCVTVQTRKSPPTVGYDKASGNNLVGDNKGQMPTAGEHPEFQTLDVKKQPWITESFSKCDGNSDGRPTAPEYAVCAR